MRSKLLTVAILAGLCPKTALGRGILLLPNTRIVGTTLDDDGQRQDIDRHLDVALFLLERRDIDTCNVLEQDLARCRQKKPIPPPIVPVCEDEAPSLWQQVALGTGIAVVGILIGGVAVKRLF